MTIGFLRRLHRVCQAAMGIAVGRSLHAWGAPGISWGLSAGDWLAVVIYPTSTRKLLRFTIGFLAKLGLPTQEVRSYAEMNPSRSVLLSKWGLETGAAES